MSDRRAGLIVFLLLSMLYFFSIFHRVGMAAIASNLMSDFNTDASILGLMSGMYFYSYALAQIPVGIMLDKIGIRKTLTALGVLASFGDLIFSLSPSIFILSLGRGMIGFGVGGFYVSSLKALRISYNPKRYATLTGVLTSVGNLGALFASSPLAFLTLAFGWRDSFLLIFFFMLLFVGVAWLVMKEEQNKSVVSKISTRSVLKSVFTNRQVLKLVPGPLIVYALFISFQGLWVGPFLHDVYGMNESAASLFFMFIGIGFMISFPIAGLISDRIRRRKPVLLAGHILNLLFWLAMALFGGFFLDYELIGILFFLGFGFGFVDIFMTMPVDIFPLEIAGSAIAGLNIFNFIGGGFFQFFMGLILDSTYGGARIFPAYQIIFLMASVGVLTSLIFALFYNERPLTDPGHPASTRSSGGARSRTL